MSRSLRRAEQYAGIDGLALLRLYHAEDASVADDILAELRNLLDAAQRGDESNDVHGARLPAAEGYARWAAVYDAPGNVLVAHEEPVVRAMLHHLEGEPILDVGCGTGRHLVWLHEHHRRVIGVDQSPEMLAWARAKVPDVELRVGDLTGLPVETASVAGLVCALSLEHVVDLKAAYQEFARAVAPGGWIVISDLHPLMAQVMGWGAWFVDEAGRGDVESHLHSISDHINAGIRAGLQLAECVEIPITLTASPPPEVAIGSPIAHDGLPLVLVLRFVSSAVTP